jgi:hypothetical protein
MRDPVVNNVVVPVVDVVAEEVVEEVEVVVGMLMVPDG